MNQTHNGLTQELESAHALLDAGKHQEALGKYRGLAHRGSIAAQLHLGWMYQEGTGVQRSLEEACKWYQKAADSNSPLGQYYLGLLHAQEENYQLAIEWLNEAAEQGYMPALYRLGKMYETGKGVAANELKAHQYFERASKLGHLFAQRAIAGKMIKGRYGITKIPKGLYQFVRVLWLGWKIGIQDLDDERIRT